MHLPFRARTSICYHLLEKRLDPASLSYHPMSSVGCAVLDVRGQRLVPQWYVQVFAFRLLQCSPLSRRHEVDQSNDQTKFDRMKFDQSDDQTKFDQSEKG